MRDQGLFGAQGQGSHQMNLLFAENPPSPHHTYFTSRQKIQFISNKGIATNVTRALLLVASVSFRGFFPAGGPILGRLETTRFFPSGTDHPGAVCLGCVKRFERTEHRRRWNFKKARCEPKPGCEPCQTSGRARRASGRVRAIAVVSRAIAAMFEPRELRGGVCFDEFIGGSKGLSANQNSLH